MENRKSRKSTFLYVILLTLCVPLAYVYLILVTGLLDKIQEGHIGLTLMIVFLPLFFYWGLVAVVGIINIGQSFKIYKTGNPIECVNRMLIHKYGLVVFFCVNFLVLFIYYFFISMAVLVGSRNPVNTFPLILLNSPLFCKLSNDVFYNKDCFIHSFYRDMLKYAMECMSARSKIRTRKSFEAESCTVCSPTDR